MLTPLKNIWRPDVYQGDLKKPPYFEGWFYKIVDATTQHTFAFIPGIRKNKNPKDSHAFLMILEADQHLATYHTYNIEKFTAMADHLDLRIGSNRFCNKFLEVHVTSPERTLDGRLEFDELSPWPVRFLSPGVMGWYAFMPFMQCYHGVLSFDHSIKGRLVHNREELIFDGGRGYIEKDWGHGFPKSYVWIQSNHFKKPRCSIMVSVAHIPWLGSSFQGFIAGLWNNGRLYRFTTYSHARLERFEVKEDQVSIIVSDKQYSLSITARRDKKGLLHAPYDNSMLPKISESLDAVVHVELYDKTKGEMLLSDTGRCAGMDVHV